VGTKWKTILKTQLIVEMGFIFFDILFLLTTPYIVLKLNTDIYGIHVNYEIYKKGMRLF
jgi:hypothetical protein